MNRLRLALAAVPVLLALGTSASTAVAVETPCTTRILCTSPEKGLRDDVTAGIKGSTGYGSSLLAVNTAFFIQISAIGAEKSPERKIIAEVPAGYAYLGVDLHENPTTSKTECHKATGWITFADLSNTLGFGAVASDWYPNNSPGYRAAWPISINSLNTGCPVATRGQVTIENVALNNVIGETTFLTITGTITGKLVQPGKCEGGSSGIELSSTQAGLSGKNEAENRPLESFQIPSSLALLCFVAANNSLYPAHAPTWTPATGKNIWGD